MSSPINIPINLVFLHDLIDQLDYITNPPFPFEEIIEEINDFINTHAQVYEFKYDGEDKDIKNILNELECIKLILDSNSSAEFKVEAIRLQQIYRSY